MIRNSKKQDIVRRVLGVDGQEPSNVVHVVPGHLKFLPPITLTNDSDRKRFYTVKIIDQDDKHLLTPELAWVNDTEELKLWIREGFCKMPSTLDSISH